MELGQDSSFSKVGTPALISSPSDESEILIGVDAFTSATCLLKDELLATVDVAARECVSEHGKALCVELGGTCKTTRDGYYWISSVCIALGGIVLYLYVQPAGLRLQGESFHVE